MQDPVQPFDWHRMLIDQFPVTYLGEIAFRTVFMFIILLSALTVSGKREVRQLSIVELVLVIGLGSAAGDPMFYHDVPLASALVVFVVVMGCYKLATYLSDRNRRIRRTLEGKPVYVIEEGRIIVANLDQEDVTFDDLLSDLRAAGIKHLGQIETAILEHNGQLSVFPYEPWAVRLGLPILPKVYGQHTQHVDEPGAYACCRCGQVRTFTEPIRQTLCSNCQQPVWVKAIQ